MRKWLRGCAAAFLSLTLLFCSGCQVSPKPDSNIIHLTLWHGINPPPNRDVFQELVDRFNQTHQTIEVEPLYVGQADRQLPKILTAVIGNASPDIFWFPPMLTGQLRELGAIQPLDEWWENLPVKSEVDPAMLETMQLDGQIWSVPMATNNAGVFYRPSLFAAAGIEELPKTWEELRQAARQLTQDTDGDGKPDRYGMFLSLGKSEWVVFTWLPFMYSAGGEWVKDGQPNLDNEGAIAALQFWSDLIEDGSAILSPPERGYEQDDFISGRVAMQITGPWTLGFLPQTAVKDDYGVIPIPQDEQPAAVLGGENLFVMKTTPQREAASREFLAYVLSKEFQTQWALGTGYLPVNVKAQQSEEYQAYIAEHPVLKVFLEQMQWARSRPLIPGYARLSDHLGRAIEATLLGESPQKALKKAQNRLIPIWESLRSS
ncbi:ABC transporter substrate-binding protein [Lusitaniella coriacea LEGE 07157]|uniref:ABC transporter substrate-binding protein n=1 Tax=Lusitaniella coriacea LEGE 07157 TaxID=945747 RepID=A0A8J7JB14_9CYAN|nr:ABC transporter substrate-binding protein [Lusitaniella coriacea]MBE9116695.1 ABC transporter substrate-binding protein [Lusitaniella coriacea LEGE 07157]